jgi:hypothetical protein
MKNQKEKLTLGRSTVRNVSPHQLGTVVGGDDVDIIVIGGLIPPNPI